MVVRCVACGQEDDADHNAAIEIRRRGLIALDLHDPGRNGRGSPGSPLRKQGREAGKAK